MKKTILPNVRIYIFLFLLLLAFIFVVPLQKKINKYSTRSIKNILTSLSEQTGLNITYKSLSPSVLSYFYINGISVYNGQKESLLFIDKAKINYNLIAIFKGNFQKGISSVVIDGIEFEAEKSISLLQSLFEDSQKDNNKSLNLSQIKSFIPGNIKLKNIALNYLSEMIRAQLFFYEINLKNNPQNTYIAFQSNSKANINLLNLKKDFSLSLDISGNLLEQLENSFLNVHLNNLNFDFLNIKKLSFLATYKDKILDFHSIQNSNYVFFDAFYNVNEKKANATFYANDFYPTQILFSSGNVKKNSTLKKFQDLCLNADFNLDINLEEKLINYDLNGDVAIPHSVMRDGMTVSYNVSGTGEKLNINSLNFSGQNILADLELSYSFKDFQLSGIAQLPYLILPNGNVVSTEVYFDPLKKGFMMFSPQVFLGNKSITALQLNFMPQKDSYDFNMEFYDYSRADVQEPAQVVVDGSYLIKSNYLQTSINLYSLFLDSLVGFAQQVLDVQTAKKITNLQKTLEPYMISGDAYISTDLHSISYNVPYVLLANKNKENQFLMLSLNGNEQTVQLNQMNLIFGKYAMSASASVDISPDLKELFFVADLNAGSVPYHLSGTLMPQLISVYGDYGTNLQINLANTNNITASATLDSMPLSIAGNTVIISMDSNFYYDTENGPYAKISRLEIEGADANFVVNPKFIMSGNVTKYGAQLDSVTYSDLYSVLEGDCVITVNINEQNFDSAGILLKAKNPLSDEAINIEATITNPERIQLSAQTIRQALYFNSEVLINNFNLNRFTQIKNDDNLLTAGLFASGTFDNPYVALNIEKIAMLVSSDFLYVDGSISLEEKDLTINNLNFALGNLKLNVSGANLNLDSYECVANAKFTADIMDKNIIAPININISDVVKTNGKLLPESFGMSVYSDNVSGTFIRKPLNFNINAIYTQNLITIFSSEALGLYATIMDTGEISGSINTSDSAVKLKINGKLDEKNQASNIKISDLDINIKKIIDLIDIREYLVVNRGQVVGNVSYLGSFASPSLRGALRVNNPEALLPKLEKELVSTDFVLFTIVNDEIDIHEKIYNVKKQPKFNMGCKIYLNKWAFDHLELSIHTLENELMPACLNTPYFVAEGDISYNLNLYLENYILDITGSLFAENVSLNSRITALTAEQTGYISKIKYRTALQLKLGTHAQLVFDPILRCIFVPNTAISLKLDLDEKEYEIDGELAIKSGDISYLNRNFYLKAGNIKFNSSEITNPLVTLSAETREKDSKNQNVRIILTVENQYLLDLTPRFSSIPAKSEAEINELLGQIVMADSNNPANLLFAASDYALQSAVVRQAENKLREILNFDIFSIRTNVLQNTLNLGVTGNLSKETLSIGNFLDNSTVYIGKYLGSVLYVDAMLHLSFQDNYFNVATPGALIFQPEFGLEMESPFGIFRWNMAPDINALMNRQFVPSSSLSLSWKFAF